MREVTRDYAQVNGEQTTACVAEVNDVLVTIESTDTGEKVEEVISTRIWRLRGLRMTADNYGDFERGSPSKLGALGTLTLISERWERVMPVYLGISYHKVLSIVMVESFEVLAQVVDNQLCLQTSPQREVSCVSADLMWLVLVST